LNFSKSVAIVGTRNNSNYGKHVTEKFIQDITSPSPTIISGLAFGIDTIAHRTALKQGLNTVAVLAHGLDTIYPPGNNALAKSIISNGALVTEFISGTAPDKHNFPSRNRIVAGLSDATVLIETGIKGGSMITADLASGYNRDVFAFPGKITDKKSEGCNYLIQQNKAILYTSPDNFLQTMGWENSNDPRNPIQPEMFVDISEQEKMILEIIRRKESVHIDELLMEFSFNSSILSSLLLSLEMKNLVSCLPGRKYRIL
jgi:DNA processing protein